MEIATHLKVSFNNLQIVKNSVTKCYIQKIPPPSLSPIPYICSWKYCEPTLYGNGLEGDGEPFSLESMEEYKISMACIIQCHFNLVLHNVSFKAKLFDSFCPISDSRRNYCLNF